MSPLELVLILPMVAGLLFALIPSYKISAGLNVLVSLAVFVSSLFLLASRPVATALFLVDDLNAPLIVLTTFITFTTSIFSVRYIAHELATGHLQAKAVRLYHPMFQAFLFAMLLALCSNNLGVMWVAVEGATLATVLLIGLSRTHASLEASWKYFILCGVGIALALFGTTLFYLAAQPAVGSGMDTLTWSVLLPHAAQFNPALMNIAFVFLLVGYGTKAGLVPMHAWLPDAHAEGPTPISALLSGLLLNVAIVALLRFKMLMAGTGHVSVAGPLMVAMGLLSLGVAGLMMYRRTDVKRLFAYSSVEHMGIIAFAFGLGGPLANFAGLLHMLLHSLTKSGLFFVVGHIAQARGSLKLADIRGLTHSQPLLGWALVFGVAAIVGMPPFGLFTSEFLLVTSTVVSQPWLAVPLVLGLLIAFGALILKLQAMAFGPAEADKKIGFASLLPFYAHLSLVLLAGFYLPSPLVAWFQNVAKLLG